MMVLIRKRAQIPILKNYSVLKSPPLIKCTRSKISSQGTFKVYLNQSSKKRENLPAILLQVMMRQSFSRLGQWVLIPQMKLYLKLHNSCQE
jgi:hypothetical protein